MRRLEIVETGRRRRWSATEKLRIVEEIVSGPRLVSATERHHGLSKQLLFSWCKAYREGQLGGCPVGGFVPAGIVSEVQPTTECAAPAATCTLEVVTANGRRVIVDRNVDIAVATNHARVRDTTLIPIPTGVRVWLATGHTDMRRGFPSPAHQSIIVVPPRQVFFPVDGSSIAPASTGVGASVAWIASIPGLAAAACYRMFQTIPSNNWMFVIPLLRLNVI
ncbi:transposase [Bradyrhizobium japonicum]|uniref:transposase n=1 Tax=Bradyrhizobium japonicum TaxID=375 RepID=UPI001FD8F6B9|nr:transposase [Bradyrhizobium japonicum]